MKPLGLSLLEMRGIVESAFQPLHCTCEAVDGDCFTIRIEDLHTGSVHVIAERVSIERFASSGEISHLIAELRSELHNPRSVFHTLPPSHGVARYY